MELCSPGGFAIWNIVKLVWMPGDLTMKIIIINKTNDLMLSFTPENVTQHSRIVTTTCKGSSTPTKMSKIIGRQTH